MLIGNCIISILACSIVSLVGFITFLWFHRRHFRGPFFVPARKSKSNAILLGGLPLALGVIAGIIFLQPIFVDEEFGLFVWMWFISSSIIISYGYLDDRFELRPIVKLAAQIIAVFIFSIMISPELFATNSSIVFVALFIWGLGVINGANLLDGLDGMAVKLGIVTFGSFILFGFIFQSASIVAFSSVIVVGLAVFYFFNREPAKIHLGEIGGCFLGFSALFLASLLFKVASGSLSLISSFSLGILPLTFPMVEVGVSMLRRLLNKRTPFKGDRLHVHQILVNYYGLSASRATGYMAIVCAVIYLVAILISSFNPFVAEVFAIVALTAISFSIGKRHWKTEDTIHLRAKQLIKCLTTNDVLVIDQKDADDFQFSIIASTKQNGFEDRIAS